MELDTDFVEEIDNVVNPPVDGEIVSEADQVEALYATFAKMLAEKNQCPPEHNNDDCFKYRKDCERCWNDWLKEPL